MHSASKNIFEVLDLVCAPDDANPNACFSRSVGTGQWSSDDSSFTCAVDEYRPRIEYVCGDLNSLDRHSAKAATTSESNGWVRRKRSAGFRLGSSNSRSRIRQSGSTESGERSECPSETVETSADLSSREAQVNTSHSFPASFPVADDQTREAGKKRILTFVGWDFGQVKR